MKSPSKHPAGKDLYRRRGLRFERTIVAACQDAGLIARRLPEGGMDDEGDIEVCLPDGTRMVVEAKHAARINIHQVLAKAARKTRAIPALAWRRPPDPESQDPGPLITMRLADWLTLITR